MAEVDASSSIKTEVDASSSTKTEVDESSSKKTEEDASSSQETKDEGACAATENPNAIKIEVDPLSDDTRKYWDKFRWSDYWSFKRETPMPIDTPVYKDKVRFVCISDTHGTVKWHNPVPPGDVLLHAGDFTCVGEPESITEINDLFAELPHTYKICIAGNHDMTLEPAPWGFMYDEKKQNMLDWRFGLTQEEMQGVLKDKNIENFRELLTNCIFLEDTETTVFGLRVYGSPWQPAFGGWGYNLRRGQKCLDKWNLIPEGIDVLLTHGPPLGHGDVCLPSGRRAGCVELLHTVMRRVKPKLHVFGHIHEGYGQTSDVNTTYVNASIMSIDYKPRNKPIIFDIPLPPGVEKPAVVAEAKQAGPGLLDRLKQKISGKKETE